MTRPRDALIPFLIPSAAACYPHAGNLDRAYADQVQALAFRGGGARASFTWPDPDLAPQWQDNEVGAWEAFRFVGADDEYCDVEIPFRLTEGFATVTAFIVVVTNVIDLKLRARIKAPANTPTGVFAESTGDGVEFYAAGSVGGLGEKWRWLGRLGNLRAASVILDLTPTVPATNRFAITPQLYVDESTTHQTELLDAGGGGGAGYTGNPFKAYIQSMMIVDCPDEEQ